MKTPILTQEDMERERVAFPLMNEEDIAVARQYGHPENYAACQSVYEPGTRPLDFYIVLSGALDIVDTSRDEEHLIVTYGAGNIVGDINGFSGRPAVAACRAAEPSTVLRLPVDALRHLLIRDAELGEKWIRAFLRRRELLQSTGFEGLRVFGDHADAATLRLREFFYRNGVPHRWIDTADPSNAPLISALGEGPFNYPVVGWSHTVLMQNPTLREVAAKMGILQEPPPETFDVVIIGSGPAGLGASVYAASEGLRTIVLDRIGPGGQAGASSRIENYAGFPAGLSGRDLALRTFVQALKFGAHFSAPVSVTEIRCMGGDLHEVATDCGAVIRTKTIIIATGVTYRALDVPGLRGLTWRGVYFSATQVEAFLCREKVVHVIGGGNSAGQAAMYLSKFTDQVHLVVRGGDLRKSMSSYLSERVEANSHIRVRLHHEIRAVEGSPNLERICLEDTSTGTRTLEETAGVFIFIGATPHTGFIGDTLKKDSGGYLLTGADVANAGGWPLADRSPCALETSCPGVFAAGDCRSRTTKRVAFAVGDGALAVTCVHDFLGTYS